MSQGDLARGVDSALVAGVATNCGVGQGRRAGCAIHRHAAAIIPIIEGNRTVGNGQRAAVTALHTAAPTAGAVVADGHPVQAECAAVLQRAAVQDRRVVAQCTAIDGHTAPLHPHHAAGRSRLVVAEGAVGEGALSIPLAQHAAGRPRRVAVEGGAGDDEPGAGVIAVRVVDGPARFGGAVAFKVAVADMNFALVVDGPAVFCCRPRDEARVPDDHFSRRGYANAKEDIVFRMGQIGDMTAGVVAGVADQAAGGQGEDAFIAYGCPSAAAIVTEGAVVHRHVAGEDVVNGSSGLIARKQRIADGCRAQVCQPTGIIGMAVYLAAEQMQRCIFADKKRCAFSGHQTSGLDFVSIAAVVGGVGVTRRIAPHKGQVLHRNLRRAGDKDHPVQPLGVESRGVDLQIGRP